MDSLQHFLQYPVEGPDQKDIGSSNGCGLSPNGCPLTMNSISADLLRYDAPQVCKHFSGFGMEDITIPNHETKAAING